MPKLNQAARVHSLEPDALREFDAHIYYSLAARSLAADFRDRVLERFPAARVRTGRLIDRPIGPHPLPMFELNFRRESFSEIVAWLDRERGPLTILVHPVTGFDLRDHTEGACWLGERVSLDYSRLDPDPAPSA